MLAVWQMICQAVSIANSLATGAFLEQVVHEQIAKNGLRGSRRTSFSWFTSKQSRRRRAGSTLTIANVYASGGHDMYRERAMMRAKEMFKAAEEAARAYFESEQSKCVYIGQTSIRQAMHHLQPWQAKREHPKHALDATGRCKFAHRCDQWVTEQPDGTKGGICGSWKHCRAKCDNPKKSATKVDSLRRRRRWPRSQRRSSSMGAVRSRESL